MNVRNKYGVEIDYATAVNLMDDDIREELHEQLAPCTEQEFFTAYEERVGENWELSKENPCY